MAKKRGVRKCNQCGEIKALGEFRKSWHKMQNKYYYRGECKSCEIILCRPYKRKYKQTEKGKENDKRYDQSNKNKERCYQYYQDNKETLLERMKQYREENKKKIVEQRAKHFQDNKEYYYEIQRKIRKTPKGALDHRISNLVRISLKRGKDGYRWEKLLGYTRGELMKHLESKFTEDMSWDNFINGEIHIDHIIPRSMFNYSSYKDQEFKDCWALGNIQPLWAADNLRKQNKIA